MVRGSTGDDLLESGITHRQAVTIIVAVVTGMFVAALDTSIMNVALPVIVGDLGGIDQVTWVVTSYLLASTIATPLYGKLSDVYGRKAVYQGAAAVFILGSTMAGFSQTMGQLVAFRALQGVGAGGLIALPMAIIGDIVSPRERGRYLGYLSAAFALSALTGPLVGGLITDQISWRWIFFVNIPVGGLSMLLVQAKLTISNPRRQRAIDWAGAGMLVLALSPILLALTVGGDQLAWDSPAIWAMFGVGLALLAAFLWWESRAAEPIVPLRLFRVGVFTVSMVAMFMLGFAIFSSGLFVPIYLQVVGALSATESGFVVLPMAIGMTISSVSAGRLIVRYQKVKPFVVAGLVLVSLGLFLLSRMTVDTGWVWPAACMAVIGLGIGSSMPPTSLIVQNAVSYADLGVASTTMNFVRSVGSSVGAAVLGALFATRLDDQLTIRIGADQLAAIPDPDTLTGRPEQIRSLADAEVQASVLEAFTDATTWVFLISVPVALVALGASLLLTEVPLRATIRSADEVDEAGPGGGSGAGAEAVALLGADEGDEVGVDVAGQPAEVARQEAPSPGEAPDDVRG